MLIFDLLGLFGQPLIPFLAQDMTDFSLLLSLPFYVFAFDLLLLLDPLISFLVQNSIYLSLFLSLPF